MEKETIAITGIGAQMQGVGRCADGRVMFVPYALPGETVEAELIKEDKRFCEGRINRIVEASPDRRDADCPYYERCGGCKLRHAEYAAGLELKRQSVRQQLQRIGGMEEVSVEPVIGAEDVFRYRNKTEFSVEGSLVGMRCADTKELIPLEDCLLADDNTVQLVRETAKWIAETRQSGIKYITVRTNKWGELMLILSRTNKPLSKINKLTERLLPVFGNRLVSIYELALKERPGHALDGSCIRLYGSSTITDELLGLKFELSPQTFFQVNRAQTEKLYRCVLDMAALTGNENVFDAYCGCGTISLALTGKAKHVIGVEIVPPAIENAKRNAKYNNLSERTEFICGDAAKVVSELLRKKSLPDVLVVDPPRKGVDASLIESIIGAKIGRIVYVSCNPGSLARDIGLLAKGGYKVEKVQPVDMFPMTEHVETVVLMSRKDERIKKNA